MVYQLDVLCHRRDMKPDSHTSIGTILKIDGQIRSDFESQNPNQKWAATPSWAYWVARNVIMDEWLAAEDLILTDNDVWLQYSLYTERLKLFECLGASVRGSKDYLVDEYGLIQGWKPGHGPVLKEKQKTVSPVDIDRICKQVENFKKSQKMLNED